MELLIIEHDYCVQKILLAAHLAELDLSVKSGVSPEELLKLDSKAKSMVLKTRGGNIVQHISILRYIGEISAIFPLNGSTPFENAQVDQWLEFAWSNLG
jgi:glutathione S-transferase